MSASTPQTGWQPVTISPLQDRGPVREADERAAPLAFELTPRERDIAQLAKVRLVQHVRQQNARDAAQARAAEERALAEALERAGGAA